MNPEEGELRPQLLDRFGLCVEVSALHDTEQRVEVMRRRRRYDEDPVGFRSEWDDAESDLRQRIERAREMIDDVETADEILYVIADLSLRAGVDGHRPDTVMARAAAAFAALEGRTRTSLADVEHVAPMVLAHRLRRTPLERVGTDTQTLRAALAQALGYGSEASADVSAEQASAPGSGQTSMFEPVQTASEPAGDGANDTDAASDLSAEMDGTRRDMGGRRQLSVATTGRGRYTRSERPANGAAPTDIAFDATVRAAALDANPAPDQSWSGCQNRARPHSHQGTHPQGGRDDRVLRGCQRLDGRVESDGGCERRPYWRFLTTRISGVTASHSSRFGGKKHNSCLSPTASVGLAGLKLQ